MKEQGKLSKEMREHVFNTGIIDDAAIDNLTHNIYKEEKQ